MWKSSLESLNHPPFRDFTKLSKTFCGHICSQCSRGSWTSLHGLRSRSRIHHAIRGPQRGAMGVPTLRVDKYTPDYLWPRSSEVLSPLGRTTGAPGTMCPESTQRSQICRPRIFTKRWLQQLMKDDACQGDETTQTINEIPTMRSGPDFGYGIGT